MNRSNQAIINQGNKFGCIKPPIKEFGDNEMIPTRKWVKEVGFYSVDIADIFRSFLCSQVYWVSDSEYSSRMLLV